MTKELIVQVNIFAFFLPDVETMKNVFSLRYSSLALSATLSLPLYFRIYKIKQEVQRTCITVLLSLHEVY